MRFRNRWSTHLTLGLSSVLVLGSANLSGVSVAAAENILGEENEKSSLVAERFGGNGLFRITLPDDYYDEVVPDDSDLSPDDEVGEENPTWEDYEQEMQDQQNKQDQEEEEEPVSDIEVPAFGYYFYDVDAVYVVTRSDFINGTVEYKAPLDGITIVQMPSKVNISSLDFKVTSVANQAFKNYKLLTDISVGDKVTRIGVEAFKGAAKLKSATLGSKVKSIGKQAFAGCKKLTKITIPANVTKIGKQAFADCKKLKNINIKTKKLTNQNLGKDVFKNISKKAVIKVPKSKLKAYQKLFQKKGLSAKVKVKAGN